MKKYMLLTMISLIYFTCQVMAQTHNQKASNANAYPYVARVSAYEAYVKYKAGKALIFHGGGMKFSNAHIVGAFNLDLKNRESLLKKFPKKGIEIFTYCY